MKLFTYIKQMFQTHYKTSDLRDLLIQEYGEEMGEMYDNLNAGVPIGDFIATAAFLNIIEEVKQKYHI